MNILRDFSSPSGNIADCFALELFEMTVIDAWHDSSSLKAPR